MRLVKPADLLIVAAIVALTLLAAARGKGGGGALFVEVQGPAAGGARYRAAYPLGENRIFSVEGLEGEIRAEIRDGAVSVISAPCKNGLCVASPPLRHEGEWTACVPGAVIIRIESSGTRGGGQAGVDAIVY